MTLLLSLMPPIAWILLFLALLLNVSYLYIYNKNRIKVVISSLFILALIGSWSWGDIPITIQNAGFEQSKKFTCGVALNRDSQLSLNQASCI